MWEASLRNILHSCRILKLFLNNAHLPQIETSDFGSRFVVLFLFCFVFVCLLFVFLFLFVFVFHLFLFFSFFFGENLNNDITKPTLKAKTVN